MTGSNLLKFVHVRKQILFGGFDFVRGSHRLLLFLSKLPHVCPKRCLDILKRRSLGIEPCSGPPGSGRVMILYYAYE
jgi:hypothetical protein